MNIMGKRKKSSKSKEKGLHISGNYTRYVSTNGYKFWAKGLDDAIQYCKVMNWKTYSKHDIRRSIQELERAMYYSIERITRFETLFSDYIEMQELEDKFKEFLDGKYKQPERKQG